MNNIDRATNLIRVFNSWGVREFCVCAGARNAPLVVALERSQNISIRHFFDERSAAFFALGRTKSNGDKPVAVVTTSGTAVAELYPAVIEAYYTQRPLLLVTADRPPQYRNSGAPQSMNQVGVFNNYATTFDLGLNDQLFLKSISGPTHINISFNEPLLAEENKRGPQPSTEENERNPQPSALNQLKKMRETLNNQLWKTTNG